MLVCSWIINCLSLEVAAGLSPTEDATKMWANIQEMYGKQDLEKSFTLRQILVELKQRNYTVISYYNCLSAMWNELDALEETLEESPKTLT